MSNAAAAVLRYHQRTKHHFNAYAKGPDSLRWEDQPHPFRRFLDCETLKLPTPGAELTVLFADLDRPETIAPQPLSLQTLGLLLELSFGLSAWKQYGSDRWALRCNPSSGNLHPTEAYLICNAPGWLQPGVYHYVSHDHSLERRCRFFPPADAPFIYVGLSSIHWREAWKYGERAFRYCQHDIGHALAALSYAAATLGWHIELLSETADNDLAAWLGLDRAEDFVEHEAETPDLLCRLWFTSSLSTCQPTDLSPCFANAEWYGKAASLSAQHLQHWPIIDDVARHAQKPATALERWSFPPSDLHSPRHNLPASQLIRQRRSAQRFDSQAEPLPLADFHRILAATLPGHKPPFSAWNWRPHVHLILFVHRVAGLESGLYLIPRDADDIEALRQAFSADFTWQSITAPFPCYRLHTGNIRQAAKTLCCHQDIASDSAFSLGMLARFADNIERTPWRYRHLFWECGLLGQILYLEAEAAGVRGTGIGCFFDDGVHGVLGLTDATWQSLYHFTVGQPLNDNRLQTLSAYAHLSR